MDSTLGYVRESLSNYLERELANTIYQKLENKVDQPYKEFTDTLEQEEIQYLNDILPKEIKYAEEEKDDKRYHALNDFFENLY